MTLIVTTDDGKLLHEFKGVLDYEFIYEKDVINITESKGKKITKRQIKEVSKRLREKEKFDTDCIYDVVMDVLN